MNHLEKVSKIINELENLNNEISKLTWVQYTTGFDLGIEAAYLKLQTFMKDKKNFDIINEHRQLALSNDDKRRVEIVYKNFEPYHLSDELNELNLEIEKRTNELSKVLNTHRSRLDGKEITSAEISQILYMDGDRDRRKAAFLARTSVNKALADAGFVELLKLRNEYARLSGAKDFVEHKLDMAELDSSLFNSWKDDLHVLLPKMKEKRTEFAQKYLNDSQIMPWDELYINGKIAPALNTKIDLSQYYNTISGFFSKFGIDITKYNITYDIFPRAQKSEWGYNFTIETGKDSRILANVKNLFNEYNVLLHETGHAVHSFNLDPEDKMMNMGVSGIISEGIANLFGGLIYEKPFYEAVIGDSDEIAKQFHDIKEYKSLTAMRSILNILFDQQLYRSEINSIDDITSLFWDMSKELFEEEPYADEPAWGFRIHHTTHPIYLHNYFMGDVTCEMLAKAFKQSYGVQHILDKPKEFGAYLIDNVIKESGRYKYHELYKRISGEDFSLKVFME